DAVVQTNRALQLDSQCPITLQPYLHDDRLDVDLSARHVEFFDDLLEGVVVLRRRIDDQRIGRRVGRDAHFAGELTGTAADHRSNAAHAAHATHAADPAHAADA